MKFAAVFQFSADAPVKAPEVRPEHRQYLIGLRDAGKLAISGPFEGGGALIVYEAEKREDVEKLITDDPFAKHGVFEKWDVRPWNILYINRDLLPE